LRQGNNSDARRQWESLSGLTKLLFAEPSPAPAKYWLERIGLIESAEVRLPMVEVSTELARILDAEIARRGAQLPGRQSSTRDSRSALPITLIEDSAIAAAPIIGDNRILNKG
jgi:hypothetical protein